MAKRQPTLPSAIAKAVRRILDDDDCLTRRPKKPRIEDSVDSFLVTVDWAVELSYRGAVKGVSEQGVQGTEPVTFVFPHEYPQRALKIRLRNDFPRNFPHLQPNRSGHVEPCTAFEDREEVFNREGLSGVLVRLSDWLGQAGRGELMNEAQGWEPTLRNQLADVLVVDRDKILAAAETPGPTLWLRTWVEQLETSIEDSQTGALRFFPSQYQLQPKLETESIGPHGVVALSLIAVIPVAPDSVCREFINGRVATGDDLLAEATGLGACDAVRAAIENFAEQVPDVGGFPVGIVIGVNRPVRVLGTDCNTELVSYVARINSAGVQSGDFGFEVAPAGIRDAVSPALLARFSGLEPQTERSLVIVGAGSLGSKIALHEARRGAAPAVLVDHSLFWDHNAARHALLPKNFVAGTIDANEAATGAPAKAAAVKLMMDRLGGATEPILRDIADILRPESRDKIVGDKNGLVLCTAGRRQARTALCAVPPSHCASLVTEAFLAKGGKFAGILVEGNARNPDLCELFAEWMQKIRLNPAWLEEPQSSQDDGWIETGQGCGSATVAATDAAISAVAASVAEYVTEVRRSEDIASYRGAVGIAQRSGISLHWSFEQSKAFLRVKCRDANKWHISLSPSVVSKIKVDIDRYPNVETGGYLLGHMNPIEERFIVVDVIEPPEGSVRSASRFDLAPLPDGFEIQGNGGQYLDVVGTWHSHLGDATPSPKDRNTAAEIAEASPIPRVLLVTNGNDWDALVARRRGT